MPVPQHVLNWLYSVLTSEYRDVNRTYNDVARVLGRFSSLTPRTDVHTFPNGTSALLVHISGTIPVIFRGSTYRFPLSIWVPHAYPREPPILYVTPTETMTVRPGQHVDLQGQIYHPYLVRWSEFWDKSTIEDFLSVLSDVFAKEPPVIARQAATRPAQIVQPTPTPPPLPPLPPEMTASPDRQPPHSRGEVPPRPPPKPHDDLPSSSPTSHAQQASQPSRYESAPPLPSQDRALAPVGQHPPPLRPHPQAQPPPPPEQRAGQQPMHPRPPSPSGNQHPPTHFPQGQWQPQAPVPPWNEGGNGPAASRTEARPAPPPPNILDEPLAPEVASDAAAAAPPIPPNPEKDALLMQLGQTLASMRQRTRQQNESSMAGLKAQRTAMQEAMAALQSETGQLSQLSKMLASNTSILHEAMRKADDVIESSKNHPLPDIDELLVAPTVVSNQLYNLVAEERALGDAIFMLGRAVERGRISAAVFAKMTRTLAREWYLKKALVRKIGQGMGLAW
ncbi:hypothetical protein RJ55_01527 [Drechmeria coniospora]|nr:hypothetical protein RJ55_01527 [Drechmeria coniospora]